MKCFFYRLYRRWFGYEPTFDPLNVTFMEQEYIKMFGGKTYLEKLKPGLDMIRKDFALHVNSR